MEIGVNIGLSDYYNQYNYLLKDIYLKNLEKEEEGGCLGTDLKIANYDFYKKDKDNIEYKKCSKKIYKKVFCHDHYRLSNYLSIINHQAEKLYSFSSKLTDLFNNKLGNNETIDNYIKKCLSPDSKNRINIFILFFSLCYDIIIRKEREALCYYFLQDEGHHNAIKIREDTLSTIQKYIDLKDISKMNLERICNYYDILGKNYWLFKILSLDNSRNYLDCLKKNSKNKITFNIINLFKRLKSKIQIKPINYECFTIEELFEKTIKDNKKIFKTLFGENDTIKLILEKLKENSETKNIELPQLTVAAPSYNILENEEINYDESEVYELETHDGIGRQRNRNDKEMKKILVMMKNYTDEMHILRDESFNKLKLVYKMIYKRLSLFTEIKSVNKEIYEKIVNTKHIFENKHTIFNNYSLIINDSIDEIITRKLNFEGSNDYLKFLLLEKNIVKLYTYGDPEEFQFYAESKINFFTDFNNKECHGLNFIIDFICENYKTMQNNFDITTIYDMSYYIKFSKIVGFEVSKKIFQEINNTNKIIKRRFYEYLELCKNYRGLYEKVKCLLKYTLDE